MKVFWAGAMAMAFTGPHLPIGQALRFVGFAALLMMGIQVPAWGASTDEYHLSVGDVVSFDFLDDTLLAQELTVASDGQINVPLIGGFDVAGLTVSEAADAMRKAFVDRRLFIDPQISLAVSTFRPIFVLGDVNAPGSFPFQPMLAVEQAIALAGGRSTGAATQDRVVVQARLRGDLDEVSVLIAREALATARVTAQLAGRVEVTEDDLPANARDFLSSDIIAALMPTEQKILESEQGAYETRRVQLTAAIKEVEVALANLGQLVENQKAGIVAARSNVERVRGLYEKGIMTLTELTNLEHEATAQESHLLEIYNQMSATRRELGELQRQLADATANRTRDALVELQQHQTEIERLVAAWRSTQEQIFLVGSLEAKEAEEVATITFLYQIRRKVDGQTETLTVDLDDAVAPGDTILVSIDRSDIGPGTPLASTAVRPMP